MFCSFLLSLKQFLVCTTVFSLNNVSKCFLNRCVVNLAVFVTHYKLRTASISMSIVAHDLLHCTCSASFILVPSLYKNYPYAMRLLTSSDLMPSNFLETHHSMVSFVIRALLARDKFQFSSVYYCLLYNKRPGQLKSNIHQL